MREYYVYDIPVFIVNEPPSDWVNIPSLCKEIEEFFPRALLKNIEVIYIGNFKNLEDRGSNAIYSNGAIYITAAEPTNFDILENFVHEVAHSLEQERGWEIYDEELQSEFLGKRRRLQSLLQAEGYEINPVLFNYLEYNRKFDEFLSQEVGYPTLQSLTTGLFVSPYGATSLQEYFANGFENYFLEDPKVVRDISPVLYHKIERILND